MVAALLTVSSAWSQMEAETQEPGPSSQCPRPQTSSRQTQAAGEFWRLFYSNGPAEDCAILASCSLATASKKMLPEKEGAS